MPCFEADSCGEGHHIVAVVSRLTALLLLLQVAKRELQESNWQLLAKVKKAEAERKALKQQQWK